MASHDDIEAGGFDGLPIDALMVYKVKSDQKLSKYKISTKNNRITDDTIGIKEDGSFSFGEKSNIEIERLFTIPIADVRKNLKDITGKDNFDDTGFVLGGKAIKEIYEKIKHNSAINTNLQTKMIDEFFDRNAHPLREYRQQQVTPPTEVKPSDRMAATEASFNDIVKQNPDMMITLDDGTVMRLADYANGMKADQNLLEALTTCRLA